ncbi:MAG TPA: glycosyltransferase [bacterium]|nr:glycosyltransferase [bacterium]
MLSVCLPAHNEARALPATLRALLTALAPPHWPADRPVEILLAANACTDDTAAVFAATLTAAGRITPGSDGAADRIITVPAAGKWRAWNALTAGARGDVLLFCDADIIVDPAAPAQLVRVLADDPAAAAAAGILRAPVRSSDSALYRRLAVKMTEFATKPVPFINGPLYAVRRAMLPGNMPDDTINDDLWLGVTLGAARIRRVPAAFGWQRPPAVWGEYYRREVRMRTGDRQAHARQPEAYAAYRRATADPRDKRARAAALSAAERMTKRRLFWAGWLQHAIDRAADRAAGRLAARAAWRECAWATAPSSKAAAAVPE